MPLYPLNQKLIRSLQQKIKFKYPVPLKYFYCLLLPLYMLPLLIFLLSCSKPYKNHLTHSMAYFQFWHNSLLAISQLNPYPFIPPQLFLVHNYLHSCLLFYTKVYYNIKKIIWRFAFLLCYAKIQIFDIPLG